MRRSLLALAVAPMLLLAGPAAALNLTFSFSFSLGFGAEGVAYGPDSEASGANRFFIAEENTIHVYDLSGNETRSFNTSGAFDDVRGIDYRPGTGTLLISTNAAFSGLIPSRVREISLTGTDVGGGIDFTLADFEPEAAFFHDDRGTVFVADEEGDNEIGTIQEFLTDGTPGDGVNGVLFQVSFTDGPYDDPTGLDWDGDFIYMGDDNSGGGLSRLQVFDLNGTSVFTQEWVDLTDVGSTSAQTVADCAAAPDTEDECRDFEGMTIDLIDVGNGPELHLVGVFEDQEMLIAWALSDLPTPPSSVPGLPIVPEPSLAWLLGAGGAGFALRARR